MINERFFQAERRAVIHAPEMFARAEGEDERMAALTALANALGDHVAAGLLRLTSAKLQTSAEAAEIIPQAELGERLGREAAGFAAYTSGRAAQTVHLSVGKEGLDESLSAMFGSAGNTGPEPQSNVVSPAAALLRDRIARLFGEALNDVLAPAGLAYRFVHSGPLPIFQTGGRGQFMVVGLLLCGEGQPPMRLQFALHTDGIDALLMANRKRRATASEQVRIVDPATGPWGAIELDVRAILSESRFPLSRLAALEPGAVISLPINRKVPLVCDGRVLAHGTVGEMEDRIALRVTDLSEGIAR